MTPAKRRFVLRALVVVNLLMLVPAIFAIGRSGDLLVRCGDSLLGAQWVLLPFWVVLGTSRMAVRAAGLLFGCALFVLSLWAAVYLRLSQVNFPYSLSRALGLQISGIVMIIVLFVAGAIIAMRLAGLRLVCFTRQVAPRGSIWPQFSLRQLLVLTGAVAVVLSVGNSVRSFPIGFVAESRLIPYLLGAVAAALLTCVIVWAALSPAPPAARVSLANLLAVLISLVAAYYLRVPVAALPEQLLAAFVEAIWISGSLLVVRACGYRAIWPADWIWAAGLADQIELTPDA